MRRWIAKRLYQTSRFGSLTNSNKINGILEKLDCYNMKLILGKLENTLMFLSRIHKPLSVFLKENPCYIKSSFWCDR